MFQPVDKLRVSRRLGDGRKVRVGELAQNSRAVFFQYDAEYLDHFHSLSPFTLFFNGELQQAPARPHHGVHGVFADSLPDGWGLSLMDQVFTRNGLTPDQVTVMDRLAYVGEQGLGALSYDPISEFSPNEPNNLIDIADLGRSAVQFFEGSTMAVTAALARYGGSPGGSRPKAQIHMSSGKARHASTVPQPGLEPWIVKFTSKRLPLKHQEGLCEAAYLTLAKNGGIEVPEWRLIDPPDDIPAPAWLALRRFDCPSSNPETGRLHMHTLCGLLDADYAQPSLDYETVIKASQALCQSPAAGQAQFARAIFNLFACNQDDHSKNWSLLMDGNGRWNPAPFYDATFSPHPYGEHTTAFMGHGKTPPLEAVRQLALLAGFKNWKQAEDIIGRVVEAVGQWPTVAKELDVKDDTRKYIQQHLETIREQNRHLLTASQ